MKAKLSIIVVHYQVEDILFECLKSIYSQKIKFLFEVIVVDNGSDHKFKYRLLKQYKKVKYIQAKKNLGYGGGNNLGVKQALGKYLFFLNPDTILQPNCLYELITFIESNSQCGIVAPTLIHSNKKIFGSQGALTLTPLRAIAAHSIFHKIWSNNPVAKKFNLTTVDKTKVRKVEVVPGTAFVIPKELFKNIGKFDPHFFLYFEEFDLCRRVLQMNKEIWMLANAKVIHHWGKTTKNSDVSNYYKKSFHCYLVKYYGFFIGNITYLITQISKLHLILILLFFFIISLILIVYRSY
ncbi:MAG: glycosyltransferase family 2 protein [Melioribacteraceae bacterium]